MAKSPQSKVGAQRAALFKLTSFNPIRAITPAKLASALDAFDRGEIRQAVLIWQKIMERDDMVKACHPKRTRNVTGLQYEILPVDDSPQAQAHAEALKYFYNNLTAFHGLNENERGGLRLLLQHVMTAVGLRYAAFELIWKPAATGQITAEIKFLPLQFFENTSGRLRYLRSDTDLVGVDPDEYFGEGNWMVATGEGIMEASSVAWMFKSMPLKAWVSYCDKFGIPGLHAKTTAAQGSPEWQALVQALGGYGEDLALVTNDGASIAPLVGPAGGSQPHPPLVERMDRAISRLWLGGDLATMSAAGGAVGSQPQSGDLARLQEDDAAMVTDAFQLYLDRAVIRQLFGEGVAPLAYFQLKPPAGQDTAREILTDQFLIDSGAPVGVKALLERYGRSEPAEGDTRATPKPAGAPAPFGALPQISSTNERRVCAAANESTAAGFRASVLASYGKAQATRFAPLLKRLDQVLDMPNGAERTGALERLRASLPEFLKGLSPESPTVKSLEAALGTALASGATEARAAISP